MDIEQLRRFKSQIEAIAKANKAGNGTMTGSCIIAEFPSRMGLDAWLAEEPYVQAGVWKNIEISPCAIGPSFANR